MRISIRSVHPAGWTDGVADQDRHDQGAAERHRELENLSNLLENDPKLNEKSWISMISKCFLGRRFPASYVLQKNVALLRYMDSFSNSIWKHPHVG